MVRHDVNQETGNPRALSEALRLIRERASSRGGLDHLAESVLVLPAAEPDGVCATHILTSILRLEGIRYCVQPVDSYTQLESALKGVRSSIRTVVLLNCGAIVDLTAMAGAGDVVLIVIDSHRPIHLKNVQESARILVLDDDLGRGGYFPADAIEEEGAIDESDGANSEDEEEVDPVDDVYDPDFIDDGNDPEGNAKKKLKQNSEDPEVLRRRRKAVIKEYYEGFYFGSPSSLVLYSLAADLGYKSQQLLWLAVVGLASYLEMGYFSQDTFRSIAQDVDQQHSSSADAENINGNTAGAALNRSAGGLRFQPDLRLTMYRHWSLFQALWHTPYVYSKLELHRDHGHGTIQRMLVYAGISPDNYHQTYSSMSHSAKKLVHSERFKKRCGNFGLDELTQYQFVRCVRMKDQDRPSLMLNELSASDLYFMLTSALQTKGFNYAMDLAINTAALSDMHDTITHSLDIHRDICVQAKMILDKRSWRLVDGFRFCVIEKPTSQVFLSNNHAVRWLALFLMQVLAQRRQHQTSSQLPFLVCIKNYVDSLYLCVGVDPQDCKSEFVYRFRNACETTATKIQLNSFDFSLAQVPSASFQTWTSALLRSDPSAPQDDYLSDEAEADVIDDGGDGIEEDESVV